VSLKIGSRRGRRFERRRPADGQTRNSRLKPRIWPDGVNLCATFWSNTFSTGQAVGSTHPAVGHAGRGGQRLCTWNQGAKTMSKFLKLIKNSEGATAIEYGLIAALIAVAAIGAMQGIGNKLNTTFNNVSNHLG